MWDAQASEILDAQASARPVGKSVQGQSRPERGPFQVGDFIYYWRKGRDMACGEDLGESLASTAITKSG